MNDRTQGRDQGQQQQSGDGNYGHPMNRIFDNQTVKGATDAVVIIRGPNGPQLWATGQQSEAKSLLSDAAKKLGITEFERA